VNELFEFVSLYVLLYLAERRGDGKKEVGQESDMPAMREEIIRAVVLPVALGSEDQSQSTAV
jgi:hypothetical protein